MRICTSCKQHVNTGWSCLACGHITPVTEGFLTHAPDMAHQGGGFKNEFFSQLSELEESNFWFKARNEIILWALRKYCNNPRNFLEIGCGTGYVLSGVSSAFPGAHLSGSEIFLSGLNFASRRVPSAQFMQMDARKIPFVSEFDAIGAFDVLEHIEEDQLVLSQIHQALAPRGKLLLTVPQLDWLWSAADERAMHVRRYSANEIQQKITSSGFSILRSTSFVSFLLPAMYLSRRVERDYENNPYAEFNISNFLNRIFFYLMMAEKKLIEKGVNFTFGGSRLIIAERKE